MTRRRGLMLAFRVTVSAAMLAFLLTRFHLSTLMPRWHASGLAWLAAGLAVTLGAIVLAALRWQRVLEGLDLRTRLSTLLSYYLAGLFVGNFLPSTIGGDVLRISRLSAGNGEPPASFASVVLERLSGWLVLPLLTLVGLLIHPALLHLGTASRVALVMSIGALVLLAAVVAAGVSPRLGGRLAGNKGWLRFVGAVHLGMDRFRRHPAAALGVLGVSCAYQLTVVVAGWMAAHALGLHIGITVLLVFVPAVAIAQVVPISVGGLGLREGALVVFLHPLGVSSSQAIALGLVVYGMNLAVSLLGAPAFAVGPRPARVTA